ncbi:hypothetical protein J2S09_003831 [Bacillus fengqiuensis]|nr:hypothetical protein [Bacillus fengqiuensis]
MIWIFFVSLVGLLLLCGFLLDRHDKRIRYHYENHPNSQAYIRHIAEKEVESKTTTEYAKIFK